MGASMIKDANHQRDLRNPVTTLRREYPDKHALPMHSHAHGQLIFATTGVMEITANDKLWLVPPQRAVWMPPGVEHRMRARGTVALHTLYIRPDTCPARFADEPLSVPVSGLLRELILRVTTRPEHCDIHGHGTHMVPLLLDELRATSEAPLHMPDIVDWRLARICEAILADTSNDLSLEEWSRVVGASTRTLARLFRSELGVSFRTWRQQARVLAAVPRLAAGEPVIVVAADLGYETPGAFTAMFSRLTGRNPSRYFRR